MYFSMRLSSFLLLEQNWSVCVCVCDEGGDLLQRILQGSLILFNSEKYRHFRKVIWQTRWHVYWSKYKFERKLRAGLFIAFDKKAFKSASVLEREGDLDYVDGRVFSLGALINSVLHFLPQFGSGLKPHQSNWEFAVCWPTVRIKVFMKAQIYLIYMEISAVYTFRNLCSYRQQCVTHHSLASELYLLIFALISQICVFFYLKDIPFTKFIIWRCQTS